MPREIFLVPMAGTGASDDPYHGKYTSAPFDSTTTTSADTGTVVAVVDEAPFVMNDLILIGTNKKFNKVLGVGAGELILLNVQTWGSGEGVRHKPKVAGTLRYAHTATGLAMIDAGQWYLDAVESQSDATRLATEATLQVRIGAGKAAAAKTIFDAAFIPSEFVNAGDTPRTIIRGVAGMFFFSQRMEGKYGEGFKARAQAHGVTLNSTWTSFPTALKNDFIAIRDDHGWGNLGITGGSTLRDIFKAVSTAYGSILCYIGGMRI